MKKQLVFLFMILFPLCAFAQETQKRILYRGDSLWYAGENQLLLSSTDKGISWDTIFAKNSLDTIFFNGELDTATNVFISDQRTLFVFGWDGTMHYKTVLYSSTDCGKSWSKTAMHFMYGVIGVKYLHKISSTHFFLEGRNAHYLISEDAGKTWTSKSVAIEKFGCPDERFKFHPNGIISYGYHKGSCVQRRIVRTSNDGGKTWSKEGK